jgi:hypothetical protein
VTGQLDLGVTRRNCYGQLDGGYNGLLWHLHDKEGSAPLTAPNVQDVARAGKEPAAVLMEGACHHPICASCKTTGSAPECGHMPLVGRPKCNTLCNATMLRHLW